MTKPRDAAPLAICSALSGDPYVVAPTMAALTLRECGWRTALIGADTPAASLCEALAELNAQLLVLSVGSVPNEQLFLEHYDQVQKTATQHGAKIVVGGRALTIELRKHMQYHFAGETLAHLASFVAALPIEHKPSIEQD